jgi:hypothetical protein
MNTNQNYNYSDKSRRMRWTGHAAHMQRKQLRKKRKKNEKLTFLVVNPEYF